MEEIKRGLFQSFSKKFRLVLPEINKGNPNLNIFEAKEKITSEDIDNFLENFFEEKGFSVRKNKAGFLLLKGKEILTVCPTNFSGKHPFTISISVEEI